MTDRRPGLVLCAGPRAAEEWLLQELDGVLDTVVEDPALLARPVRVVVPSRSLRLHLGGRTVARRGGALGLAFQTLEGLVEEILAADPAEHPRDGQALFPILVRQVAEELAKRPSGKTFADQLAAFEDGYGCLAESVSDLIDAGFLPEHHDALRERIDAASGGAAAATAHALLHAAGGLRETFLRLGRSHRAERFERALVRLESEADCLRARAVFIYGYADATGSQAALLEGLIRYVGARAVIDLPRADTPVSGGADFPARLIGRLSQPRGVEDLSDAGPGSRRSSAHLRPSVHHLAVGTTRADEVQRVASRIQERVAEGAVPERIAVVARDLAPYALPLGRALRARGVPYSGVSGHRISPGPGRRRILALVEVQRRAERARFDVWLTARGVAAARVRELRLWGATRLVHLTVDPPPKLGAASARLWREAREFEANSVGTESSESFAAYRRSVLSFFDGDSPDLLEEEVKASLDAVAATLPPGFFLNRRDFVELMENALKEHGLLPLGGEGGGVQVLSVTEARGLTFGQLFVLGMNRDLFPRRIQEDPLFPDFLRGSLTDLLPELPVKARGFEEERYLAAQLSGAAPELHWSFSLRDEQGLEAPVSPLLEGILLGRPEPVGRLENETEAGSPGSDLKFAGAEAVAVYAGLRAAHGAHGRALRVLLEAGAADRSVATETGTAEPTAPTDALDEAVALRLAEGNQWDRPQLRSGALWGEVEGAELDKAPLYVTGMERLLACPWRFFVERLLKIPGRAVPPGELPRLDPRQVGNCVHRTLQRIGESQGIPSRSIPRDQETGRAISWPDPADLDQLLRDVADEVLREAGIALPGFARALMERSRAHVESVRSRDKDELFWVGVEVEDRCAAPALPGGALKFRVDRVEALAGKRILTDYKTGKNLPAIALQTAAYARATGTAEGRYLFTHPDLAESTDRGAVKAQDTAASQALDEALASAVEIWQTGAFFPRLSDPKSREPAPCRYCEVSEACRRGGSPNRRALAEFAEAKPGSDAEGAPAASALRRAFRVSGP